MRFLLVILCVTTALYCCADNDMTNRSQLDVASEKMLGYINVIPLDSTAIPRSLEEDGSLITGNSRQWTSGFFPGTLWQLYSYSQNDSIKKAAEDWTAFIEKEKYDDHTHDLGFKLNSSFGKAYAITENEAYKNVVITASKTLINRYNENIGSIRSWDWNADVWQFPVIIDNMMNLEMLFDATRFTGDSTFHHIATQHALTTNEHHYRADNSCFHVVDFDTTTFEPRLKTTHQGYSDESAWSRGQAWGLYGFTVAYGRTGNDIFLDRAKKSAQYIYNHPNLPEDKIPYWDFNAPNIPDEPRDVSAATVTASALLELIRYDQENTDWYLSWTDQILESLATDKYQSNIAPFLLLHSTGSVPGEFEVDQPIVYADYYYIEALLRRDAIK
ncbi:glycoside hydrolase family 88 protein [Portibacter marinus]|uniref:glycoside hydrolase family 88 protein n=1 Tax=Portibacter marinus TaxID=2898660 RepID=UPI001F3F52E4|nr:glycoside hydrolase family 88 protein [Portibacter marinus]